MASAGEDTSGRYAIVDYQIDGPAMAVEFDDPVRGIAVVSRRQGRVVGFSMHATGVRTRFDADEIAAFADPHPRDEAVLPRGAGHAPSLTVAICTHDRPDLLEQCLRSLAAQVDPPDEILVVDNAPSDDRPAQVVASLATTFDGRLRTVVERCPGLDVARNRALREAGCEVVAFVDDDVVVDRHWSEALRSAWKAHPEAGGMTGQILPLELETDAQIAFERRGGFRGAGETIVWSGTDLPGNPLYPYSPGMFGAGANLSVRRSTALRLGGFDEALDTGAPLPGGGDMDMCHRLIRTGHQLVYEPRAVVFHRHRRDQKALRRQYDSWGRSLAAWATKVHRIDVAGRPKIRRLAKWFVAEQLNQVALGLRRHDRAAVSAAAAELRGAAGGLAGAYTRSQRRTGRLRRQHGRPRVAIMPWGDVIEDYLEPIGLGIDDFAERLDGGWLFGFCEALDRVGVDSIFVAWTGQVVTPTRRVHLPTGAPIWFLPQPRAHRWLRRMVDDPYAWSGAGAAGTRRGPWALAARVAHQLLPYSATAPVALARVLRNEGVRAMLFQEYEEGRFDVAGRLGRLLGLRVCATFQGGDHTRSRAERLVRSRSVREADGLAIADRREIDRIVADHQVDRSRIWAIPNPFDPATLPPGRARAEVRTDLGLSDRHRLVVWHGRVDIQPKGIDVLIDAWEIVVERALSPVHLALLGTGSGAGWLHAHLADRAVAEVSWTDEYVLDRRRIADHLRAGDLYVLPSRQEGFPVAPVEAMAMRLPVVASDAPGVRSVIGDDGAGTVVPCDDPDALAEAIVGYVDDPAKAATAGEAGRRRVERFSPDAVGEALRAMLVGP